MAGISYCDSSYHIERACSEITVMEYVMQGRGHVWIDSQYFCAEQGDFYMLPEGAHHNYRSDENDPWTKIWFNARGPLLDALMQVYRLQGVYHVQGAPKALEPLFRTLVEDARAHSDNAAAAFAAAALHAHAIMQTVSLHLHSGESPGEAATLRRYLDSHVQEDVSIAQLCALIFRSPSQTIRIFTKAYGVTPYEYLMRKRVETARLLLQNTNLSVREIANRLSFADERYFSTYVKKRTGLSPTKLRRNK
jgi:AraC-like DNA-binding protein